MYNKQISNFPIVGSIKVFFFKQSKQMCKKAAKLCRGEGFSSFMMGKLKPAVEHRQTGRAMKRRALISPDVSAGAQSDSEVSPHHPSEVSVDRGYTSDSEVYTEHSRSRIPRSLTDVDAASSGWLLVSTNSLEPLTLAVDSVCTHSFMTQWYGRCILLSVSGKAWCLGGVLGGSSGLLF